MQTHRQKTRLAFGSGAHSDGSRVLPEEVAVALSYNGSTHAVMMATPADLVDFAYGFSITEGIASVAEIDTVDIMETPRGIDLQIWLMPEAEARQSKRRRTMAGPVGCGLCGIDSLEAASRALPRLDRARSGGRDHPLAARIERAAQVSAASRAARWPHAAMGRDGLDHRGHCPGIRDPVSRGVSRG